jgi:hypothetical protein
MEPSKFAEPQVPIGPPAGQGCEPGDAIVRSPGISEELLCRSGEEISRPVLMSSQVRELRQVEE